MIERRVEGQVPRKHHIVSRDEKGNLLHEECFTRAGFDGPYTIMYHQGRPHAHRRSEAKHGWTLPVGVQPRELARRHYKSNELPPKGGAPIDVRVPLVFNADVVISSVQPNEADPVYFSNGDGDDLFFIFEGKGVVRTLLGDLPFQQDDYVFIPRAMIHRIIPEPGVTQRWLSIECLGDLDVPKQWRNEVGQLRMDAPYCHRDFRGVTFKGPIEEGIRELVVKRSGAFHGFTFETTPLDVVGWDGTVYPWVFPILNFQPRAGLVHLPPTWHGTFATRGALICSFVPRMTDFHPEAIPCPYPHSSPDCDEILFYVRGNFTSRRGVGPGSISHHPAGVMHGPHPGSYEKSIGSHSTNELAVMLDTFLPLQTTAAALGVEDANYHESFI